MQLQLFGTMGCHLCEQADAILSACCQADSAIVVESIDIAEHEQWQPQYAVRIPVLRHPASQKELGWPFDFATVLAFITELKHD